MATAHRAEVIGSLLRPAYLKEARARHAAGAIGHAELKRVEDRAVDDAVALQTGAGVSVVTDGEMRRYAYFGHFIDSIEGFDKFGGWAIPFRDDQGNELLFQRAVVVSRLKRLRHLCAEEFTYLRGRTDRPTKATLISALNTTSYYDPDKSAGAYPTRDAYLSDAVDILRGEVDELVRLGCTYIQMDGPPYTLLLDPATREGFRRRGTDPERLVDLGIEMDNAVIGHHPGVTFALHLCRGNNQSLLQGGPEPREVSSVHLLVETRWLRLGCAWLGRDPLGDVLREPSSVDAEQHGGRLPAADPLDVEQWGVARQQHAGQRVPQLLRIAVADMGAREHAPPRGVEHRAVPGRALAGE